MGGTEPTERQRFAAWDRADPQHRHSDLLRSRFTEDVTGPEAKE
jgi:hypothetical protein